MGIISIAEMYNQGVGFEKDPAKAFEYYLKAAEKGLVPIMSNVALAY